MKRIPNVSRTVELPADFEALANRLGFTLEEYVWLLAADKLANPPDLVRVVMLPPAPARENIIRFPGRGEAA